MTGNNNPLGAPQFLDLEAFKSDLFKPESEEALAIWNAVWKATEEAKEHWKDSLYGTLNSDQADNQEYLKYVCDSLDYIPRKMALAMRDFIDTKDAENTLDEDTDPQYTEDPDADPSSIEEILDKPGMNQIFSQPGMENLKKTLLSLNASMKKLKDNLEEMP